MPRIPSSLANRAVFQVTDKMVEKLGVQRTPGANPEMYKSDDYSVHLKGDNQTPMQQEREAAGQSWLTWLNFSALIDSKHVCLLLTNRLAPHQPVLVSTLDLEQDLEPAMQQVLVCTGLCHSVDVLYGTFAVRYWES